MICPRVVWLAESTTGAKNGALTVRLYGTPDGLRYRAESVTLASLPLPEGEEGEEGLVSESFLCVYGEGGELISRTRVRKDVYAPKKRGG